MKRVNEVKAGRKTLRVLVADNTMLTGRLIAEGLSRDRRLSVTNVNSKVIVADASAAGPDVVILSETLEGTPGRGFEVLTELRAAVPRDRVVMLLDSR